MNKEELKILLLSYFINSDRALDSIYKIFCIDLSDSEINTSVKELVNGDYLLKDDKIYSLSKKGLSYFKNNVGRINEIMLKYSRFYKVII